MKVRYAPLEPEELADPAPTLAALRRDDPVHRSDEYEMWVLTRYDDVVAAARDTARFSSRTSTSGVTPALCPGAATILARSCPLVDTLVTADPPEHGHNRQLISPAFSAQAVATLEPVIRMVTADLIGRVSPAGAVDFVKALAVPLPMTVLSQLFGFPTSELTTLKGRSDGIAKGLSADLSDEDQVQAAQSTVAFQRYISDAVADRREAPRDDLVSRLVNGVRADGRSLELAEILSLCQQVLVAGNETTTNLIASAMWLLLQHPDDLTAVRNDHSLVPAVVEESLRLQAPVQGRYRVAIQDLELHGQPISAGDRIQLHLGAANRDPTVFVNPDRFDLGRKNLRAHVGFGSGPHFCIGASLARLEARIAVEVALSVLPDVRQAAGSQTSWRRHFHLRGLESLHIEWFVDGVDGSGHPLPSPGPEVRSAE